MQRAGISVSALMSSTRPLREREITKPLFLDKWLCPTKADQLRVAVGAQDLFFRFRKLSRLSRTPCRATSRWCARLSIENCPLAGVPRSPCSASSHSRTSPARPSSARWRCIWLVVRRVVNQSHAQPRHIGKLCHAQQELAAPSVALRSVVQIDNQLPEAA